MDDAVERFRVVRDGAAVQILVSVRPWEAKFLRLPFSHQCGNDVVADCVRERVNGLLDSMMKRAREDAYNQGYRDGRAKVGKLNTFSRAAGVVDTIGWREAR